MTTTVTVWHNISKDVEGRLLGMVDGYHPDHVLVPVAQRTIDLALDTRTPESLYPVLDVVYHLLNVGDDPTFGTPESWAVEYRERRNRSLSVGDVVHITDGDTSYWYAVASFGFKTIEPPQNLSPGTSIYGSTSLPDYQEAHRG